MKNSDKRYHKEAILSKCAGIVMHVAKDLYENRKVIITECSKGSEYLISGVDLAIEFKLLQDLNHKAILKPLELVNEGVNTFLVSEYFESVSLKKLIKDRPSLPDALRIGAEITKSLKEVHRKGVVHRNLNSRNILVNPETKHIKLTGFYRAIASDASNEAMPIILESAEYVSPELTGRTGVAPDYRGDLYSLGVILYELLTGRLPFEANDTMELVHSHIAKNPVPPNTISEEIPEVLSIIILKLLAKSPSNRYQSAAGLQNDLIQCLDQLDKTGSVRTFQLGQQDFGKSFQVPRKQYGRDNVVEGLQTAFDRVCEGNSELVLISGPSGVGKSFVVNELNSYVTNRNGFYVMGKFDQLVPNIPYSAVGMALRSLVQQLLVLPEKELGQWRRLITSRLRAYGDVINSVIPEFDFLIGGRVDSLGNLGAVEKENRFKAAFQRFIELFATVGHPLVIFLDDLQWSDAASLDFFKEAFTASRASSLLVIGAYRDNEVPSDSPMLEGIRAAVPRLNELELGTFRKKDLNLLMEDTFNQKYSELKGLGDFVYDKTDGNPFFAIQLLRDICESELLLFDRKTRSWSWNMTKIIDRETSWNVVEIISHRMCQLPETQLRVLKMASVIGNQFDLKLLSVLTDLSQEELLECLGPLVELGFIFEVVNDEESSKESIASTVLEKEYMFAHDRIQEAIHNLISKKLKLELHATIGRLLLKKYDNRVDGKESFILVNHLNEASDLLDQEETHHLAKLNLSAGKRAKESIAYRQAFSYFEKGISLLEADPWDASYSLTFQLNKYYYECLSLLTEFEKADTLFEDIVARVNTITDKVDIYCIAIRQKSIQAKYDKALEMGEILLKELGVKLPKDEELEKSTNKEIKLIGDNLHDRSVEELLKLPIIQETDTKAIVTILTTLAPPMYFSNFQLFQYLIAKQTNIGLLHGNTSEMPFAYGNMGLIFSMIGDFSKGYDFGSLGLQLSERMDAYRGVAHNTMGLCINHWSKPVKSSSAISRKGIQYGEEEGDVQFACYNHFGLLNSLFAQALPLNQLCDETDASIDFVTKYQNVMSERCFVSIRQFALNLMGKTTDNSSFNSEGYDEAQFLETTEGMAMALAYYYVCKLQSHYLFGRFEEALTICEKALDDVHQISTFLPIVRFTVFHSLPLTALLPHAEEAVQKSLWKTLKRNQKKLKVWADQCPENFLHHHHLIEAEIGRIRGDNWLATESYKKSIRGADEQGFVHDSAIANELFGRFWLEHDNLEITESYLLRAHARYCDWGASAKASALESTYPEISFISPNQTGISSSPTNLDNNTLMKTMQAISSEINFNRLLDRIMAIVIENAGAQRGSLLILEDSGDMKLAAVADVNQVKKTDLKLSSMESSDVLATGIVNYVKRTEDLLVLSNASEDMRFQNSPYVKSNQIKSVLCMPISKSDQLIGIIYLENNLVDNAFQKDKLHLLKMLSGQIAISMENARLFEEKQAYAEELKMEEEFIDQALNSLQDTFYLFNPENGKPIRWNRAFNKITGYTDEEIADLKAPESYYSPEDIEKAAKCISDAGENGMGTAELELICKDGRLVPTDYIVSAIPDKDGNPKHYISIGRDVSERKEMQARILHSEKMDAIGHLAGGVAHDFNNQLTVMMGYADMLSKRLDDANLKEYTSSILAAARRSSDLTMKLLAFSRKGQYQNAPIHIHNVINETIDILCHSIDKRIHIKQELDAQNYTVIGDASAIENALLNISLNACDAMTESGNLAFSTEVKEIDDELYKFQEFELKNGKYIVISVADNGTGIPENVLPHVFEPFYTTKPVGKGTGMGLASVYGTIQQHKGAVTVDSKEGEGTSFKVYLPLAPEPEKKSSEEISENGKILSLNILVVDDEEMVRNFAAAVLTDFGHSVISARDGKEAVDIYSKKWKGIDLVMLDMMMPNMNGKDAFFEMKKINPDVKVIIASGYSQNEDCDYILAEGGLDFIQKPFDITELNNAIAEAALKIKAGLA